jgi:hypothetical protein
MSTFLINVRLNNLQSEIDLLKSVDGLTNPLVPGVALDANSNNIINVGSLSGDSVGASTLFAQTSITTDGTITAGSEITTQAVNTDSIQAFNTPAISLLSPLTSTFNITTTTGTITGQVINTSQIVCNRDYGSGGGNIAAQSFSTLGYVQAGTLEFIHGTNPAKYLTVEPTSQGIMSLQVGPVGVVPIGLVYDSYYNKPPVIPNTQSGFTSSFTPDDYTLDKSPLPTPITYNGVTYTQWGTILEFGLSTILQNVTDILITFQTLAFATQQQDGSSRFNYLLMATCNYSDTNFAILAAVQGDASIGRQNIQFDNTLLQTRLNAASPANRIQLTMLIDDGLTVDVVIKGLELTNCNFQMDNSITNGNVVPSTTPA